MPAFNIHDVLPKVRERAERDLGREVNAEELHAIAVATIREIDHHVAADGSIVPSAPIKQYMPEQVSAHWRHGRRR